MFKYNIRSQSLLALSLSAFAACAAGQSSGANNGGGPAGDALRALYSGAKIESIGPHDTRIHGTYMTPGLTESQAASSFLSDHGAVFGGPLQSGHIETSLRWSAPSPDGEFVAFAYRQNIRGKEVEGSDIRIKVHRQPFPRVDYAAGRLSGEPTLGSETPLLSSEVAGMIAQSLSGVGGLAIEEPPQIVALCGDGVRPDAWCWRVRTRQGEGASALRRTYFVDTAMPRILYVRKHFAGYQPPTTGLVVAPGTPLPDPNCKYCPYKGPSTPLTYNTMPNVFVHAACNPITHGYSDWNGVYSFDFDPQTQSVVPMNVWLSYTGPEQLHVWTQPNGGGTSGSLQASGFVPVPEGLNFVLDNALILPEENREEFGVAQADIFVTAGRARTFFRTYISNTASSLSKQVLLAPNEPSIARPQYCGAMSDFGSFYSIQTAAKSTTYPRWNCGCLRDSMKAMLIPIAIC